MGLAGSSLLRRNRKFEKRGGREKRRQLRTLMERPGRGPGSWGKERIERKGKKIKNCALFYTEKSEFPCP